jgi:DNA-binding response OmpR family regulator
MPRPARLLCVGKDPELLRTRCAVLGSAGYNAKSAVLPEAETLLRTQEFDLIVVSAGLSDWERGRILSAAGKTPTLVLTELTLADDLLDEVTRLLAGRLSRI